MVYLHDMCNLEKLGNSAEGFLETMYLSGKDEPSHPEYK
jgi:hypothetical protein